LSDFVKEEKNDENFSLAANSSEVKREPETDHPEVTQNHQEMHAISNEGPMISSNDFLASPNKNSINPMVGQHLGSVLISETSNYTLETFKNKLKVMPEHSGGVIGQLPTDPIDMGAQVEAKLERKRERNRAAATKCRQRKIHKIQTLETHVQELTRKNEELKSKRYELKEQLKQLEMKINENPQLRSVNFL